MQKDATDESFSFEDGLTGEEYLRRIESFVKSRSLRPEIEAEHYRCFLCAAQYALKSRPSVLDHVREGLIKHIPAETQRRAYRDTKTLAREHREALEEAIKMSHEENPYPYHAYLASLAA